MKTERVPLKKKAALGVRGITLGAKDEVEHAYLLENRTDYRFRLARASVSLNPAGETGKKRWKGTKRSVKLRRNQSMKKANRFGIFTLVLILSLCGCTQDKIPMSSSSDIQKEQDTLPEAEITPEEEPFLYGYQNLNEEEKQDIVRFLRGLKIMKIL